MKAAPSSRKVLAIRLLWLAEFTLILLCALLAALLRFFNDPDAFQLFVGNATLRMVVVALFITTSMAAFGLYQVHGRHNRTDLVLRLILAFVFGGIGLLVLYYLQPPTYIGRGVFALTLVLSLMAIVASRLVSSNLMGGESFKRRILVYGAGKNAELINSSMRRSCDRKSFMVVGFIPVREQPIHVSEVQQLRTDMPLSDLTQWLRVDEVVVAPDERRGGLPMDEMLKCAQRGVAVSDISTFFERETGMVTLNIADPSWLVFSGGFDHSTQRLLSKRLFDLIAASSLLLMAWPVMVMVAICVWLESGGPILYRQSRVGESGQPFELIKFRSMRTDAEGDGVARWASRDDDRSTRVGRFIRLTRLDELPQLFNVLCGDMSFVGPRPERPQFVDMLNQEIRYYGVRHCMKPGITGWAQLRYPYGASVRDAEEKLKFDLFYVKNHGLVFDLMILLQTVEVVLFRRGAR